MQDGFCSDDGFINKRDCKFSKIFQYKLYYVEKSKTRWQIQLLLCFGALRVKKGQDTELAGLELYVFCPNVINLFKHEMCPAPVIISCSFLLTANNSKRRSASLPY